MKRNEPTAASAGTSPHGEVNHAAHEATGTAAFFPGLQNRMSACKEAAVLPAATRASNTRAQTAGWERGLRGPGQGSRPGQATEFGSRRAVPRAALIRARAGPRRCLVRALLPSHILIRAGRKAVVTVLRDTGGTGHGHDVSVRKRVSHVCQVFEGDGVLEHAGMKRISVTANTHSCPRPDGRRLSAAQWFAA